jgi:hypothetical protein
MGFLHVVSFEFLVLSFEYKATAKHTLSLAETAEDTEKS